MSDTVTKLIIIWGLLVFDMLVYLLLARSFNVLKHQWRRRFGWIYWIISFTVLGCFWFLEQIFLETKFYFNRITVFWIAVVMISKIMAGIYLVLDRIIIAGIRQYKIMIRKTKEDLDHSIDDNLVITRKKFIYKSALMLTSLPVAVKGFSIINQAYEFRIKRVRITLPNLPKEFHGIRIGQISDIHSGSFKNKLAVGGGVDMLRHEAPDLIFFTGDLVNRQTDEVNDYFSIFNKVRAPLGVFSILGNHDYGEYRKWPSPVAKQQDFQDMLRAHQELGWQLLRNENHILEQNRESLAILGVENWGIKRFSKYGKIEEAYHGTEEASTRLLLSHDPSHWEAKVLDYPDIDITFSGHTHGFQFGVEAGNFRWSPSQYLYKQWAGLYQKGSQYIYVNRGYGFIGMPGRVGINPEITIIELVRA